MYICNNIIAVNVIIQIRIKYIFKKVYYNEIARILMKLMLLFYFVSVIRMK